MVPDEIRRAVAEGKLVATEGIDPAQATDLDGRLLVGGLVPIPIGAKLRSLCIEEDVELLDESGRLMGTVCFGTRKRGVLVSEMTKWQFVAYLSEAKMEMLSPTHDFAADYVVIGQEFVAAYLAQYMANAPLWGGFTHQTPPRPYVAPRARAITAMPDMALPTPHHYRSITRYVEANDAFDRFLKLYHTIELLFDFVYMKKIQSLGDDMVGFGKIMSAYGNKELTRLNYIIGEYCDDPARIAHALTLCAPYMSRCEEMFHDHSKDGDPLKDDRAWIAFKALAAGSRLSKSDISATRDIQKRDQYDKFIYSVASYWIYRVRSSIAHSQVGEFLFVDSDETMVAEFAEPLLLEVAQQIFSSAKLKVIS